MIDRRRIEEKLAYLGEQVESMGALFAGGPDPTRDPWVARGLRYSVQTAVEAMIDIAYHLSAKGRRHVPLEAHDALDAAVGGSDVQPELLARWHAMIGLRNRLVHGYERVLDAQLAADVSRELGDFRAFESLVRGWLRRDG